MLRGASFHLGAYNHRPLSSSFLGLPDRILTVNHKTELLRGLWVTMERVGFWGTSEKKTQNPLRSSTPLP